jgi:hypothetical protein
LQDSGISEIALEGEEAQTPFDQESTQQLPRLGSLPRETRPKVLFWIDSGFQVHHVAGGKRTASVVQEAVAQAIASHLKQHSTVRLSEAGDWQWLPAIGRIVATTGPQRTASRTSYHLELLELVPEIQRVEAEARLERDSRFLQSFALVLPSGDVLTPAALVHPARQGKLVTRAVALRWASQRPSQLAGEAWTPKDWKDFERAQNRAAKRPPADATAKEKEGGRP